MKTEPKFVIDFIERKLPVRTYDATLAEKTFAACLTEFTNAYTTKKFEKEPYQEKIQEITMLLFNNDAHKINYYDAGKKAYFFFKNYCECISIYIRKSNN